MARVPTRWRLVAGVLLATAGGIGGCAKKIWIEHYPGFYSSDLKVIAVAGFGNDSPYPGAGKIFAEQLVEALRGNGTYEVLAGRELAELRQRSAAGAGAQTLPAEGKLAQVQAILTGAVTTFSATSNQQPKRDPIYAWDRKGRRYIQGYRSYVHTRNEANVSVTAALIRVADGPPLHATASPARWT